MNFYEFYNKLKEQLNPTWSDCRTKNSLLDELPGHQALFRFENRYGASLIDNGYGHETGKYEIAVIRFMPRRDEFDEDWYIDYNTSLTDDVLGYLEESEVFEVLQRIKNLNSKGSDKELDDKQNKHISDDISEIRKEKGHLNIGDLADILRKNGVHDVTIPEHVRSIEIV